MVAPYKLVPSFVNHYLREGIKGKRKTTNTKVDKLVKA